jgi:hypothetical protein
MKIDEISQRTAEFSERDLARKLRLQVPNGRRCAHPIRTRTAGGFQVERRSRRRPSAECLSA